LYPNIASNKSFIRQEHLILAEIQRIIGEDLNAIKCIWDCPIKCSLKRPDLMYELENIYLSFEVDEHGHDQSIERILEFRNILDKPLIFVRINPNLVEKPMLKQIKRGNGIKVWEKTDNFDELFSELRNIVFREIENIQNTKYSMGMGMGKLPPYIEIGFNFNKYPNDRGDIIQNKYGYTIHLT